MIRDPLMTAEGYARLQQRLATLRQKLWDGDFTWTPKEIGALCSSLLQIEALATAYQASKGQAPTETPGEAMQ